ncbi:MAG: 50S ribosomal protein L16 [Candidatus Kerfeldbacteria bacterium RIFCSPHIGHO2_12_FULL_48_17]|uniref:Large ribosomal subunit protein uL16 n=1 Tax=Candidatus Kerfeldbacteria bacterium RIFCSPHIGHO2_12_FULL_48_17 TaxID=1798542 RepID=A0A1G2B4X7_9BACT|nr:MAG: 50S ribosomal protein L16 [Candidatus Kerfeldbacteria bacterium RIFCSPHIGHO2_12_FULL_48_17]
MLTPKKVKHRKWHRPDIKRPTVRKTKLAFGTYGLKATTGKWVTARQIESARRAMTRFLKRGGKIWVRVFPDHPVTIKGGEVRMGSGKGAVDHYIVPVQPGTILFEVEGLDETTAREAFRLATHKLPVQTKCVIKE